jgi:hypothetical protein
LTPFPEFLSAIKKKHENGPYTALSYVNSERNKISPAKKQLRKIWTTHAREQFEQLETSKQMNLP